jgi:hypothetical protein
VYWLKQMVQGGGQVLAKIASADCESAIHKIALLAQYIKLIAARLQMVEVAQTQLPSSPPTVWPHSSLTT